MLQLLPKPLHRRLTHPHPTLELYGPHNPPGPKAGGTPWGQLTLPLLGPRWRTMQGFNFQCLCTYYLGPESKRDYFLFNQKMDEYNGAKNWGGLEKVKKPVAPRGNIAT